MIQYILSILIDAQSVLDHYDEPQCVAVCPVDCIIPDPDSVESVEELKFKFKQIQAEE